MSARSCRLGIRGSGGAPGLTVTTLAASREAFDALRCSRRFPARAIDYGVWVSANTA